MKEPAHSDPDTTTGGRGFPPIRALVMLGAFVGITLIAPTLGAFASDPGSSWYEGLKKPSWNPPSWVFGPVWTLLYVTMAVAAWLVWRKGGWHRELVAYAMQLVLNAIWTPLFFGLKQPGAALADILALWAGVAITGVVFFRKSRAAGLLLMPYLAWTSFATLLNASIWSLNR